jgi:hypothetical protein
LGIIIWQLKKREMDNNNNNNDNIVKTVIWSIVGVFALVIFIFSLNYVTKTWYLNNAKDQLYLYILIGLISFGFVIISLFFVSNYESHKLSSVTQQSPQKQDYFVITQSMKQRIEIELLKVKSKMRRNFFFGTFWAFWGLSILALNYIYNLHYPLNDPFKNNLVIYVNISITIFFQVLSLFYFNNYRKLAYLSKFYIEELTSISFVEIALSEAKDAQDFFSQSAKENLYQMIVKSLIHLKNPTEKGSKDVGLIENPSVLDLLSKIKKQD